MMITFNRIAVLSALMFVSTTSVITAASLESAAISATSIPTHSSLKEAVAAISRDVPCVQYPLLIPSRINDEIKDITRFTPGELNLIVNHIDYLGMSDIEAHVKNFLDESIFSYTMEARLHEFINLTICRILRSSEAQSALISLRLQKGSDAASAPKWHQDTEYWPSGSSVPHSEHQYTHVITLKGATTQLYPDAPETRALCASLTSELPSREALHARLATGLTLPASHVEPGHGVVILRGPYGAVHSVPSLTPDAEDRIVLIVMPGPRGVVTEPSSGQSASGREYTTVMNGDGRRLLKLED